MGKSDEIVGNPLVFQGGGNGSGQHGKPDDTFAKLGQFIHALLEPIARYLCYAAAIVTLLMSIFMVVDLFSRLVFNNPLSGMIELQTFMLVFMAFFSIAYTMLKNQHVAVDLITSVLSAPVNSFLQSVFSIWGIFLFGSMSWLSTTRALEAFENEEFSDIIQMPYWVLYSFAAIGTLLLTVAILALLLTHLSGLYQYHRNRTKLALIIAAIAVIGIAGIYSAELLKLLFGDLSSTTVGILYTLFLMIILMLGFPVGFAMAFTGLTGLMFLIGQDVAFNVSKINTYDAVAHYFFTVIPFFLLMGFLILHAGIGAKLYNAGIKVFGRLPGGLAIGTVAGCGATVFTHLFFEFVLAF